MLQNGSLKGDYVASDAAKQSSPRGNLSHLVLM
jgi:hypothetical protein